MTPADEVLVSELMDDLRTLFDGRDSAVLGTALGAMIAEWLVQVADDRVHAEEGLELLVRGVKRHMRLSYAGG